MAKNLIKIKWNRHTARYRPWLLKLLFLALCGPVFFPASAAAHRVIVFAWVDGDTVYTESKFSGGKRVKGGDVLVYNSHGETLVTGKTDDKGAFAFQIPQKSALRIVLRAGMGHQGEWTVPLNEIVPEKASPEPAVPHARPPPAHEPSETVSSLGPDDIRRIIGQVLDQKMAPVMKLLAESREKGPSLSDILGGLGYILGLMGLAAYLHFRRKTRQLIQEDET